MSDITDILSILFTDTATWRPLVNRDPYGAPIYGSGTTFDARLVCRDGPTRDARDARGGEAVSAAELWIAGIPAIGPEDQVELSDGSKPPIASIERFPDEAGPSHVKVLFL